MNGSRVFLDGGGMQKGSGNYIENIFFVVLKIFIKSLNKSNNTLKKKKKQIQNKNHKQTSKIKKTLTLIW